MERGNTARGTFVVLEGADGSGKTTQLKLLSQQLRQAGHQVEVFDFPQYDQPSGYFVKRYLNGDYGTAQEVGPYTGALFYALDRYDVAAKIRLALNEGKIVLADRYSGSSMAHQGAKFATAEQRRGYFIWLDNLEFETLKIPRPDINIVLRVPAELSQGLIDQRGKRSYTDKKRDLHEADLQHLQQAVTVYDDLCQLFPKDFSRIDCVRGDKLLDVQTINKLIAQKLVPILPKPRPQVSAAAVELPTVASKPLTAKPPVTELPSAKPAEKPTTEKPFTKAIDKQAAKPAKSDFYIPASLDPKTARFYSDSVNELRNRHGRLVSALASYVRQNDTSLAEAEARKQASAALRGVLPVAYLDGAPTQPANTAVRGLLDNLIKSSHAASDTGVASLVQVSPRNEFDCIPALLYGQSNLGYAELSAAAEGWDYEQKAKVLALFLNDIQPTKDETATADSPSLKALDAINYTWDLTTEYQLFARLYSTGIGRILGWQAPTPRLGFAIPKLIDDADLTDQYEESFDISLRFYSQLQQKGYDNEAQYATLLGHKLRWSATYSANEQARLMAFLQAQLATDTASLGMTFEAMSQKLVETHPLIAEHLIAS